MYHHLTETQIKRSLQVKAEFRDFISPLSKEEFTQLEANLLREGCREPLVVWKKDRDYILVDGHHRFKLCRRHGLDFKMVIIEFADIQEVKSWMIDNQLGKRNVTELMKSYLRGLQYNRQKRGLGGDQKTNRQNVDSINRQVDILAEEHKVSSKTIERDASYAKALDKLTQKDMDLKWKILNKDIHISKRQVVELVSQGKDAIERARVILKKEGKFRKEPLDKYFAYVSISEMMMEDEVKMISKKLLKAVHKKDLKIFEEASHDMEKLKKKLFSQD